ncbi:hypothetical protein AX17_005465 [Amanita inopinata Kibby_2008]|nr:hypothetical protein AX17_005465 [Amanita inopinata Kibby_2008]
MLNTVFHLRTVNFHVAFSCHCNARIRARTSKVLKDRASPFKFLRSLTTNKNRSVKVLVPTQPDQLALGEDLTVYDYTNRLTVATRNPKIDVAQLLSMFRRMQRTRGSLVRPTIVTHTSLILGLLYRGAFQVAERQWNELISTGLTLDAPALSIGLQTLTRVGKPQKAFQLLEHYAHKGDVKTLHSSQRFRVPVRVDIHVLNAFMEALNTVKRPDVVFKLWDHMDELYGVKPNCKTLSLVLRAARLACQLDNTFRGNVAHIRLRNPFRKSTPRPTTREEIVQSIMSIVGDPKIGVIPYSVGMWNGELPLTRAREVFLQVIFGHAYDTLIDVNPPAYALRASIDADPMIPLGLPHPKPARGQFALEFELPPNLRTAEGQSWYPDIIPNNDHYLQYLLLLCMGQRAAEIPLTLAWMRASGTMPNRATLAVALVFWAEVSMHPPLIESWTGGWERSQYARLAEWMKDWVGEWRMPRSENHVLPNSVLCSNLYELSSHEVSIHHDGTVQMFFPQGSAKQHFSHHVLGFCPVALVSNIQRHDILCVQLQDVSSAMDIQQRTVPQTPTGPAKLTVGVEESRAQRLQRQQARFRDRGGIFIPTNRNTLVDILMGRRAPSPKKSFRRSTSCSPAKREKTPSSKSDLDSAKTKSARISRNARAPLSNESPRKLHASEPAAECTVLEEGLSNHEIIGFTRLLNEFTEGMKRKIAAKSRTRKTKEKEASSGSDLRPMESKLAPKRRGRPPKQRDAVGIKDKQEASSRSDDTGKSSKRKPAPRKRQGELKNSEASAADTKHAGTQSGAQHKTKSRLPIIAEDTEVDDDAGNMNTTKSTEMKHKKKRQKRAEDAHAVNTDEVIGDNPPLEKTRESSSRQQLHATQSRDSPAKSGLSDSRSHVQHSRLATEGYRDATLSASIHHSSGLESLNSQRAKTKDKDKVSEQVKSTDNKDVTDQAEQVVRPKSSTKKTSLLGEVALSAQKKRCRVPESIEDGTEDEDLWPDPKRAKALLPGTKSGTKGGQKERNEICSVKASSAINQEPKSIAQIIGPSKGAIQAKQSSAVPDKLVESTVTKSNKRLRNPEDSSPNVCLPKRVKVDRNTKNPDPDKNLASKLGTSVKPGECQTACQVDGVEGDMASKQPLVGRKPKQKENVVTTKKAPREATKATKTKASNKRSKGLPKSVLQRIKSSVPDDVDDEPDPIDFLS